MYRTGVCRAVISQPAYAVIYKEEKKIIKKYIYILRPTGLIDNSQQAGI